MPTRKLPPKTTVHSLADDNVDTSASTKIFTSRTHGLILKLKFHGTDTDTDIDTNFRDAPIV